LTTNGACNNKYTKKIVDRFRGVTVSYHAEVHFELKKQVLKNIISLKQSYSPILPIGPQISSWSDVSGGMYNNFYVQTYNWNLYSPCKIPGEFLNDTILEELKTKKSKIIKKHEKLPCVMPRVHGSVYSIHENILFVLECVDIKTYRLVTVMTDFESNSLATTNPELALEWHPTKNLPKTPQNTYAKSESRVVWVFSKNI
jgi:hypothetical protein